MKLSVAKIWYNLHDSDLHDMLGAEGKYLDLRTVEKRLTEGGVEIKRFGKERIVLVEDLLASLDKQKTSNYKSKGKISI